MNLKQKIKEKNMLQADKCLELLNKHDDDQRIKRMQDRNIFLNSTWIIEEKKEGKKPKPNARVIDISKKPDLCTNTAAIKKLKDKIANIKVKLPIKAVRRNAYRSTYTDQGLIRYKISFMPTANLRLNFGTANSVQDAEQASILMFKLFNENMLMRTK